MVLRVPKTGLQLESPPDDVDDDLPTQAFVLTLDDSIIEEMLACIERDEDITLSVGSNPMLLFGDSYVEIDPEADDCYYDEDSCDLYLTDPAESSRTASRLPNPAMSLFSKPDLNRLPWGNPVRGRSKASSEEESGLDADIAALSSSMAQAQAEKIENSTRVIVDGPPPAGKRGAGTTKKASKKMLSAKSSYTVTSTSSLPSSPALSGIGSPSLGPVTSSASQQATEKAKQARFPILHELAFRDQTYDELWQKYPPGPEADFKTTLEKVADLDKDSQKYMLKKMYWKELDVWNYDYATDDDRQLVIENAIKQYDRLRLTASEPEWQKLLPREERGKGKCLSKVQANIAKGPPPAPAPKIKVQKAEESSADSGSSKEEAADKKKPAKGGEKMVRSSSQPLPKAKKPKDPPIEKKWVSAKKAATATPKVSPTRPTSRPAAAAAADSKPGKFKSKEFVSDSDSSEGDSVPLATSTAKSKAAAARAAAVAAAAAAAEEKAAAAKEPPPPPPPPAAAAAPKPKAKPAPPVVREKETIKAQIHAKPPMKRPRMDDDDDDSSSSSSGTTPLSKRVKVRDLKPAAVHTLKQRSISDASQNSRGTSSGLSFAKSKNTSPAKSSPLASSPPTNASDLERTEDDTHVGSKKRRAADHDAKSKFKRPRLSDDVVARARRFKIYYQQYETLHNDLQRLEDPPKDKLADLIDMRQRLESLKTEIYRAVPPVR